jgi:uncharacterized membrane protein
MMTMGNLLKTLGQKFVSGFLILLPFLLAYLLIGGFYDLTVLLTAPLQDVIPRFGILSPTERQLAILGFLFLIFVLIGLLRDSGPAERLGGWIIGSRPTESSATSRGSWAART